MGNRRALCVGVNQFQNLPAAQLRGCVNDTKDMESVLKKYLGFSNEDIVKLTDNQATKKDIMTNLKEMVDGARAGKYGYLVFSFSSHGTQVPDKDDEEPDRADEAFCPTDLKQKGAIWDPDHIITDDELRDLFVQLPKNVLLECFLDTCHSGDGLRAVDFLIGRKPRYLPPPSWEAFNKVQGRRTYGLNDEMLQEGITRHILWSACRSDQTSADAMIGGSWHGAFTYYFCREVDACENTVSRKEILDRVRIKLDAGHYSQIPQLDTQATTRNRPISES